MNLLRFTRTNPIGKQVFDNKWRNVSHSLCSELALRSAVQRYGDDGFFSGDPNGSCQENDAEIYNRRGSRRRGFTIGLHPVLQGLLQHDMVEHAISG